MNNTENEFIRKISSFHSNQFDNWYSKLLYILDNFEIIWKNKKGKGNILLLL
jgi:molecular chaperone GrpE (heat shock protein)